jgi:site-specific DNA-adenine methylase
MFYYYGRKKRIVKYYPKPKYDTIIESFAGSAAYAMEYFDRKVILYEINHKIYSVWKYLQQASEKDVLSLPILEKGQCLNNEEFNYLSDPEKWTIGLFLNPGSSVPKKSPGNFCDWDEKHRKDLSEDLYKIRHWEIYNESYENSPDIEATWFVDPPYSPNSDNYGGKYYTNNKIDYNFLSIWCKDRKGQVIVCENEGATWLPFEPLVDLKGQKHNRKEVIWYNEKYE